MLNINVFVSSTYEDLKSYRAKVRDLLLGLGLTDIAMERWPAGSLPAVVPWQYR